MPGVSEIVRLEGDPFGMDYGFFQRKSLFGAPMALLLLMGVFFLVPFAARGARMALQRTENNVKDWLPKSFRETEELEWFNKRFVSEQFLVATWDGCTEDSDGLKMFVAKLQHEMSPQFGDELDEQIAYAQEALKDYALFLNGDDYRNWGGQDEKWLVDEDGKYYYITPEGHLYRWDGGANLVSGIAHWLQRVTGSLKLKGRFIAGLGKPSTDDKPNPFWQDLRLVASPLIKTVSTGPQVVQQLAGPGRSLYVESNPIAGERMAVARLTGTLFGPPVPADFGWRSDDLAKLLTPQKLAELPEGWQEVWAQVIQRAADKNYGGDLVRLRKADPVNQAEVWYEFFDEVSVTEPPRQTCVMLTFTPPARRNLARVLGRGVLGQPTGRVFEIARECGVSPPPKPTMAPPPFSWLVEAPPIVGPVLRVGGPPIDNVAIDEEGTITLVRLIGYSLAVGLMLSYFLLRSLRLMAMVFFVGGVSAMASLSMVWWRGASVDAILLTMPSLVYVLGISGAIHFINYYRDAVHEHGQATAAGRALAHAAVPTTLCAVTTAIGMASLGSSNILPIHKFGIYSAIGIVGTLGLLFVFLPSALTMFPPPSKQVTGAGKRINDFLADKWERLGKFVIQRQAYVNIVMATVWIAMGFGLFKIQTSVHLLKLFDSESQIIQDYAWLEDHFGRLVPMELVVRFPESLQAPTGEIADLSSDEIRQARTKLTLLERAEAVMRIQDVLQSRFGYEGENVVGRGMSAGTFIKDLPEPSLSYSPSRSGANNLLLNSRDELMKSEYLTVETSELSPQSELWRISLRLAALSDVDYGQFVGSLRSAVEPIVAAYRCRKAVMDAVVAQSGEQIKGRVLVLGQARPALPAAGNHTGHPIATAKSDETVLAETLRSCLINNTIRAVEWHDPVKFPLADEGRATSDKWAKYLREYDCVVLLRNHSDYDVGFVRDNAVKFVDASLMLDEIRQFNRTPRQADGTPVELPTHPGEMDVVYSGIIPVVYKAQRTLLESLVQSVASAFVLIFLVMICLLSPAKTFTSAFQLRNIMQSIGSGAVSMIPNIFPVVVIFGFMGHARTLVDIGTMMTASVALGVAVDDTIHFLSWFRGAMRRGLDRQQAILETYRNMAPAMTQTTIISGLGLSVFALSTFTPTQRFGTLMLALLVAAVIGDLIWLPALLASPLGRVFNLGRSRWPAPESAADLAITVNTAPDSVETSVGAPIHTQPTSALGRPPLDFKSPDEQSVPPPKLHKNRSNQARKRS
ncbi:MAG: MMPL family transporter [Pirellulaceae bacterium]|nr:MMPL family transporter [Pirellulaceae bacterium]